MYLQHLRLFNFRNHQEANYAFSADINCILGTNGSGKTNLLDAVYMLALSKSFIQKQDNLHITHDENMMMISGRFHKEDKEEEISYAVQLGQKKQFLTNKKPYERISEHIGKFPVVLIAPDDTDMIRDASDTRRRLFDGIMSQFDPDFLTLYQQYNKTIDQRNGLLKQFAERSYFDQNLLDAYSEPLAVLAIQIAQKRKEFITRFLPKMKEHYAVISGGSEEVDIIYESQVTADFEQTLKQRTYKDRQAQRTTAGTHKDDFLFLLEGQPIKKFGSQGQRKSFVLAVKLAQYQLLEEHYGQKPILLLDDIFDKLDDRRIQHLIEKIDDKTFGQLFITDARPERTQQLMSIVEREIKYFLTDN